jgi:TetR/AcrR family transcriptional regulator, cholesterol catabolism regulator
MAQANRVTKTTGGRRPRSKPGVKREQILQVAIEAFGRYGYEDAKWADVASAVGIGPTALYHYFESKLHCLYEIMGLAVADFQQRFERITAEHTDWNEALVALLVDSYDLTEQEVLRNRVLVAEQGLIGIHRTAPREEAARDVARTRTRDLEFQWGTFLARGMQQGHIPESDPQLLARAVLGLYNSVWHWYRPGGTLALPDLGRFFVGRQLALVGARSESRSQLN